MRLRKLRVRQTKKHSKVIICVCNNIREKDLKENPFLINEIGTKCGICVKKGAIKCGDATYIVDRTDSEKSSSDVF